ncbi:cryptochrome/photolyase family protein [Jatrophihabitans sp.]|uniref:cryptochrome/photolyase family protein n=1 Tax=Jatrophihabitans sp. TaxID=1932789 RepID=UPI002CEF1A68|nr:deoxyribodipyrimidine photo-lyase [Jatrophihabitans sp.]
MPAVMWFRRDLRLSDNPALVAASAAGDRSVLGVFVLDPALLRPSGAPRVAVLYRTLRALDDQLGGNLVVRHGDPVRVLPALCREIGAESVHCAADYGPYGDRRDQAVADALGGIDLHRSGSPYAVEPGSVRNGSGENFKVYSAFYRAWREHGWPEPARSVRPSWVAARSDGLPDEPELPDGLRLPKVGEAAARRAWRTFLTERADSYADYRDRPDLDRTSHMSVHLKWGTIHPRTLLADLSDRHETYRRELAWREFYADVLHARPDSARRYYHQQLQGLPFVTGRLAEQRLSAWAAGRTGYPIVDAGMRQLLAEGWMHNRVRMIVASFLVKDLHLEWTDGARHFMRHLVDADLASNAHGWQWVAGTGTDAAPFYRIFNPVLQGRKFDPDGDYIRRYVPELAGLPAGRIHEPWRGPDGLPAGYPDRIVDHAAERAASLADYQALREAAG